MRIDVFLRLAALKIAYMQHNTIPAVVLCKMYPTRIKKDLGLHFRKRPSQKLQSIYLRCYQHGSGPNKILFMKTFRNFETRRCFQHGTGPNKNRVILIFITMNPAWNWTNQDLGKP